MTDLSKRFSHYPVGLQLIIGYMFLNSLASLVVPRNFVGSALSLILGIGLLQLKDWARAWSIFITVIGLIVFSLKAFVDMWENRLQNAEWLFLLLFGAGVVQILSYLMSPKVKALFVSEPSARH